MSTCGDLKTYSEWREWAEKNLGLQIEKREFSPVLRRTQKEVLEEEA